MTHPSATGARAIAHAERRTQMLALRKAGWTYERIAAQYGVTRQNVQQIVQTALKNVQAESVTDLRALENERLDDMLRAIYGSAISGNTNAIDRILRIMERRAKLLGLDMPALSEVKNDGTTRIVIEYAGNGENPAPEAA